MMNNETNSVTVEVETPNGTMTYKIPEATMHSVIANGIHGVLLGGLESPDPQARNMAFTIKSGFKAILIAMGNKMVQSMYPGQRDIPRPSRNDDVVEWYMQFFAGQIVSAMTKNVTTLSGVPADEHTVVLTEIRAKSVADTSGATAS